MSLSPFPRGFAASLVLSVCCVFPGIVLVSTLFAIRAGCSLYDISIDLVLSSLFSLGAIPLALLVSAAFLAYIVSANAWFRGLRVLTIVLVVLTVLVGIATANHGSARGCVELP